MVDQTLVTSGFDVEVLLSQRYLRYALLAQIDAGRLPLEVHAVDPSIALDVAITIHSPTDYQRLYDPDPGAPLPDPVDGSFDTSLITGDPDGVNLVVAVIVDIVDNVSGRTFTEQEVDLRLAVALTSDVDDRGFQRNHRLSISLVALGGLLVALAPSFGIDIDAVTAQVKAVIDRTVPFGVASGQAVQRVETRIHPLDGTRPAAFGVYVDLALKDGPEADAFVADRGDVTAAQNFLDDGSDLALATSPGLFGLLGRDARERMAAPDGSGGFDHPLRENPTDPDSDVIGTLDHITIGPERILGTPTGKLLIDVSGTYEVDILPDPSFDLLITFDPKVTNGLLRWDVDARVDVGILGSLLGTVLVIAGAVFLGPAAGASIFVLLVAADVIVDAVATAIAAQRVEESTDASFLDALPHRLTVMERRWDPLYRTQHQVVALISDGVTINEKGIAFEGAAVLDKEPAPIAGGIIRDEDRDADGAVTALRYRVRDLAQIADDLVEMAPGTDRRPFVPEDPARPGLVGLTSDQIAGRMASQRVLHPIAYVPKRIELVEHHIRQILSISRREIDEERSRLIDAFRRETDEALRADQQDDVTEEETDRLRDELGREPTADEIRDAVDVRFAALVDEAQADYEAGGLADDLESAIAAILMFDLAPAELARLQDDGVLVLEGKEVIRMRSGTVYFRDHPDSDPRDNLLSLPTYHAPYSPP
jgi:hypothetical protein